MATETGWLATAFISAFSLFFGTSSCPSIDTTGAFFCQKTKIQNFKNPLKFCFQNLKIWEIPPPTGPTTGIYMVRKVLPF